MHKKRGKHSSQKTDNRNTPIDSEATIVEEESDNQAFHKTRKTHNESGADYPEESSKKTEETDHTSEKQVIPDPENREDGVSDNRLAEETDGSLLIEDRQENSENEVSLNNSETPSNGFDMTCPEKCVPSKQVKDYSLELLELSTRLSSQLSSAFDNAEASLRSFYSNVEKIIKDQLKRIDESVESFDPVQNNDSSDSVKTAVTDLNNELNNVIENIRKECVEINRELRDFHKLLNSKDSFSPFFDTFSDIERMEDCFELHVKPALSDEIYKKAVVNWINHIKEIMLLGFSDNGVTSIYAESGEKFNDEIHSLEFKSDIDLSDAKIEKTIHCGFKDEYRVYKRASVILQKCAEIPEKESEPEKI